MLVFKLKFFMENTPINDNALDSELTSNESEIGAEGLDLVLQSAGFASLQDAYDQTNTGSLNYMKFLRNIYQYFF